MMKDEVCLDTCRWVRRAHTTNIRWCNNVKFHQGQEEAKQKVIGKADYSRCHLLTCQAQVSLQQDPKCQSLWCTLSLRKRNNSICTDLPTDLTVLVNRRLAIVNEKYFYPHYLACLTDFVLVFSARVFWGVCLGFFCILLDFPPLCSNWN